MDGALSIRQLIGRDVTLVQARQRVEGVVIGIAVHVEDDNEETELEVDGENGTTYVIYLTPQDWCEGICAPRPRDLQTGVSGSNGGRQTHRPFAHLTDGFVARRSPNK